MTDEAKAEIETVVRKHFPCAAWIRVTLGLPGTIGIGEQYLKSLDLSDGDKAVVNAHHIRFQDGVYVMRDTEELRRVVRIPE
jgi:hypothetical protein